MGRVRDLTRRLLSRVAHAVEKDDLFEKPGERAPMGKLPVTREAAPQAKAPVTPAAKTAAAKTPAANTAAAKTPAAKAPATSSPAAPASPPVKSTAAAPAGVRPHEGCLAVDVDGLRAAITPSGVPLVINHWATWCDPCVDELPRLVRAAAGVADLGEFIGVSWDLFDHPGKPDKVAKKVAAFADSAGVGYGSVLFTGTPEELFAACGLDVEQIPQTLVLAPDGRVVYHKKGVFDHDDVFPLIEAVKAARG